jgi:hypothetical protein
VDVIIRYLILDKFPEEYLHYARDAYKVIQSRPDEYDIQGKCLFYESSLDHIPINPTISFLRSPKNMGMAVVHIDSLNLPHFGVNIPVKVNHAKSSFFTIKVEHLNDCKEIVTAQYQNKLLYQPEAIFEFEPEKYEEIKLDHPLLVNTIIPHTWSNFDDEERVICRFNFKFNSIEEVADYCQNNGWCTGV